MIRVEHKSSDPAKGMTLADLFQFVQYADAMGIDPRTPVSVSVGFRRQIKSIDVLGATEADIAQGVKVANTKVEKHED